jgi:hypothetical protein
MESSTNTVEEVEVEENAENPSNQTKKETRTRESRIPKPDHTSPLTERRTHSHSDAEV